MTEEITIFEQDGNIVGITKEGKYFESYKTTENVAILRGAGLYIKRLEQENKELEAYKDVNEDFEKARDELNEKYKQLRSALEEIRGFAQSITDEFEEMDFEQQKHYCDEISNNIVNKITEVLNA